MKPFRPFLLLLAMCLVSCASTRTKVHDALFPPEKPPTVVSSTTVTADGKHTTYTSVVVPPKPSEGIFTAVIGAVGQIVGAAIPFL